VALFLVRYKVAPVLKRIGPVPARHVVRRAGLLVAGWRIRAVTRLNIGSFEAPTEREQHELDVAESGASAIGARATEEGVGCGVAPIPENRVHRELEVRAEKLELRRVAKGVVVKFAGDGDGERQRLASWTNQLVRRTVPRLAVVGQAQPEAQPGSPRVPAWVSADLGEYITRTRARAGTAMLSRTAENTANAQVVECSLAW
jgi:hypothetical protein